MSVLIGKELRKALGRRFHVSPVFDKGQLGYSSVDLRLGSIFVVPERSKHLCIDPRNPAHPPSALAQRVIHVPADARFVLHPRAFALAVTMEYIALGTDVFAFIEGRSSPGRTGLLVVTAGAVHPGYAGCPTLELVNAGETPLILRPADLVAQLVVLDATSERREDIEFVTSIRTSRYQVSIEPEFSK